jgi:hypothetical protein
MRGQVTQKDRAFKGVRSEVTTSIRFEIVLDRGVKNEQQVEDLWAYINQFDADGNIKK